MLDNYKTFISSELKQVDQLINDLISNKAQLIYNLGWHLISSGGKRLRPGLTILSAKLFEYQGNKHISLAAAIEFIHTATLLHDDVVDDSNLRRGQSTANDIWGNKASILVGDFLLSQSFRLMVENGSLQVLDILSNAASVISEGEVKQLSAIGNFEDSQKYYFDIIKAKTATLFEAATHVGAVVSEVNQRDEKNMAEFGLNFGIAFQIMDDVIDYSSKHKNLGKNLGDDFFEGKITLPVIHAYQNANDQEQKFFHDVMLKENSNQNDLNKAMEIMQKYKSFDYSYQQAKKYADMAINNLADFKDSQAKNILQELVSFCIKREY